MAQNGGGFKNGVYTAAQFITAIEGTGGIISSIARKVGCSWHTAKRYIDRMATVQQAYDNECQKVLDLAETVIIKDIKDQDTQTAKWYLTMKGRDRGYAQTQRSEITGQGGGPIETKQHDSDQHNRAILTLAETLGAILPGQSPGGESDVDATE